MDSTFYAEGIKIWKDRNINQRVTSLAPTTPIGNKSSKPFYCFFDSEHGICSIFFVKEYNGLYSHLKNINILAVQRLIHASDCAEFAAHRTAILVLRSTAITYCLCGFRVDGAFPLLFPIKGTACICHGIVNISCVRNFLGNIRCMSRNARSNDALLHIVHIWQS